MARWRKRPGSQDAAAGRSGSQRQADDGSPGQLGSAAGQLGSAAGQLGSAAGTPDGGSGRPDGAAPGRGTAAAWARTACVLCASACGVEVTVASRSVTQVRGDANHVTSRGYTCGKAQRLDYYQNSAGRLTSPLRRRPDGGFDEVDWDTAIAEIAVRLGRVRDTYGGETIFFYGGAGQANHLGGVYGASLMAALGARFRSNPQAQESAGESWVDAHLTGCATRGDVANAEVAVFVGSNPWQSHGIARARTVLDEIAGDPGRALVVVDPVRSETAELADVHLQVRPGTDAWCLAALLATLVQEGFVDQAFLTECTTGSDRVLAALTVLDVPTLAERCGLPAGLVRAAARRIGQAAGRVVTVADLGVLQGPNSVLCSYLHKLIWVLTGSFGRPGGMNPDASLASLVSHDLRDRRTPVTGAPILGGLVPCNVIAEEILADHPRRLRAMVVDSADPAHSLADAPTVRRALQALDLLVVVDVTMTDTGRLADYVLPAATQFEKWEASFGPAGFPRNTFHLRAPVFRPAPGTLGEPELYARLVRELGVVGPEYLAPLREAAGQGREAFATAYSATVGNDPGLARLAAYVLYETLGPTLPAGAAAAAVLWAAAHRCALRRPEAVRRAGHADGEALFEAILAGRSGVTIAVDEYADAWQYLSTSDGLIAAAVPALLDDLRQLPSARPGWTTAQFPFVLSAGQRRSSTANTIVRDPQWRTSDVEGALRMSPSDAASLAVVSGDRVRVRTAGGLAEAVVEVDDRMQPGHLALPNGFGVAAPGSANGGNGRTGVALNELTKLGWRDARTATPWHKHVPASVEPVRVILDGRSAGSAEPVDPAGTSLTSLL